MIIVVLIVGGFFIKNNIEAERLAKEKEQYISDFRKVTYQMLAGAAKSEECGNKIKNVWSNSIWGTSDKETDKYTKKNGKFNKDFNDSLKALFKDQEFMKIVEEVEENKKSVNKIMKILKNPPEDWKDAYSDMKKFYDEYLYLTNLCTSPSGSLQTYSTNFSNADTNTVNWYEKVKSYLE